MPPCNCHHPFPRPEPFSPLPRPGKVPDWGKWIRDRLAEKGALLAFPSVNAFPDPGAGPNLYLAEDTDIVYRWDGAHYQVVFDPELANDVLEYEDRGHFPETGHHGKLYIAADTGSPYRWGGEDYVALLPGKADKAIPQTAGNLAALDAQGNLADSGKKPADFATAAQGAKADTAVQPNDITDFVDGAEYDAEYGTPPKPTILLKHGSTVVATVDATDFVIDGMVSDVAVAGGNLVITFNTDSGKQPISIPLTDIFDPANYYTKTATDALLAGKKNNFTVGTGLVETAPMLYAYKGVAGTTTEGETRYTTGPADVGSTVYSWNGGAAVPTGETVGMVNTTIGRIYTVSFPSPVYYDRSAADDIPRVISIDETVVPKKSDVPTPSSDTPAVDSGSGSAGSSAAYARGDHVHPTDTSRVPTSRTVNGKALSSDVTLDAEDVGALPSTTDGSNQYVNSDVHFIAANGDIWLPLGGTGTLTYLPSSESTTQNNLVAWKEGGGLTDSGKKPSDFQSALTAQQLANIAAVSDALAFDATHSYAAGDPVVYNGTLYTFTSAHTGAWTGSDVAAVDIIARLSGKLDKSGGTVNTLTVRYPITVGSSGNERTYGVNSISQGSNHIDFPSSIGTIALTAGTGHTGNLAALDAQGNPTDAGYRLDVRNGIPCIIQTVTN